MKKADYILILIVCLLAAAAGIYLYAGKSSGTEAVVYRDSEVILTLPLSEDTVVAVDGFNGGTNTIQIKDGIASMLDADCPDLLCVHQPSISKEGQTIVCLPHRITIKIIGGNSSGPDASTR